MCFRIGRARPCQLGIFSIGYHAEHRSWRYRSSPALCVHVRLAALRADHGRHPFIGILYRDLVRGLYLRSGRGGAQIARVFVHGAQLKVESLSAEAARPPRHQLSSQSHRLSHRFPEIQIWPLSTHPLRQLPSELCSHSGLVSHPSVEQTWCTLVVVDRRIGVLPDRMWGERAASV